MLGKSEQASLLEGTLNNEETETMRKLSQISEKVNPAAAEGEAEQETRTEMAGQGQRKTKSNRSRPLEGCPSAPTFAHQICTRNLSFRNSQPQASDTGLPDGALRGDGLKFFLSNTFEVPLGPRMRR